MSANSVHKHPNGMFCPWKTANCESNHKSVINRSTYCIQNQFLLHPLMTFKSRVSRSLLKARIDENNINEENHCELRLFRALLHTTLLVWLTLCAVEYSAKPVFLMVAKGCKRCFRNAGKPMHWQLFMRQSCRLMQHTHNHLDSLILSSLHWPRSQHVSSPLQTKTSGRSANCLGWYQLQSTLNSPAP